ncbi:MAG TPA: cytochrome c [Aliiroseovarius sp.]|nr:cytochrome c [Aliiroseovarius sp.]
MIAGLRNHAVNLTLVLAGATPVAAQTLGGAMLGNTCAGCHGPLGASVNTKIPPLAGQDAAQFTLTMQAYRDGTRQGTIMNRVARAYSDDEIAAMAAYFASLPKDQNE